MQDFHSTIWNPLGLSATRTFIFRTCIFMINIATYYLRWVQVNHSNTCLFISDNTHDFINLLQICDTEHTYLDKQTLNSCTVNHTYMLDGLLSLSRGYTVYYTVVLLLVGEPFAFLKSRNCSPVNICTCCICYCISIDH